MVKHRPGRSCTTAGTVLSCPAAGHIIPARLMGEQDPPVATRTAADTTTRLLVRAQAGDADALNDLFRRHVPLLSRWARGRLPGWARDVADTHDLVQETAIQL